jgi:hypothetical protein
LTLHSLIIYFSLIISKHKSFADENKDVSESSPGKFACFEHLFFSHVMNDNLFDGENFTGKARNSLLNFFPLLQFLLDEGSLSCQFLQRSSVRLELLLLLFIRAGFLFLVLRAVLINLLLIFFLWFFFGLS